MAAAAGRFSTGRSESVSDPGASDGVVDAQERCPPQGASRQDGRNRLRVRTSGRRGCARSGRRRPVQAQGEQSPRMERPPETWAFGLARLRTGGPSGGSGAGFDMTARFLAAASFAAAIALADCQVPSPSQVLLPCRALRDREQSLGDSGADAFINRATFERHRHGRGLVRAGVVKFAVVQDGDGNQAGFSVGQQLHQAQGARPLDRLLAGRPTGPGATGARTTANPARMTARRAVRYNLVAPSFEEPG